MTTLELTGFPGDREGKASAGVGIICFAKAWSGLVLSCILYHASRESMWNGSAARGDAAWSNYLWITQGNMGEGV
jgi:hypothetical protein